jgi:hypothetical protein
MSLIICSVKDIPAGPNPREAGVRRPLWWKSGRPAYGKVAAVSTDPHRDAMAKMMVLGRKALVRM